MKRKLVLLLVLTLLLTLVAVGCAEKKVETPTDAGTGTTEPTESDKTSEPTEKDKAVIAFDADITGLDPAASNDTLTQNIFINIYSRLFKYDQQLGIVPDLADTWEYVSDLEFRVKIKEGVKFHDGTEVKAEDVKASIDRAKQSPKVKHILPVVDSIEIIDEYTVAFKTLEPFAPLQDNLVHASNCILPKSFLEKNDFTQPIGSGPYKFVSRKSDVNVILVRNDDYFNEECKAAVANLEIKIIPEGTNRTIGLETGEVDIVPVMETIDKSRVESNPDLGVIQVIGNNINYVGMNLDKAPFDNKLLRQAINYAINKEALLEVSANGIGKVATSFTPDNILGYVENTTYKYDVEKAKEILAQSGYVQGNDTIVIASSGEEKGRTAQVVQGSLAAIGLNVKIEQYEWATFLDLQGKGEFQMSVASWSTAPEPDRFFALLKEEGIYDKNITAYRNPEVQELLKQGVQVLDREKRKEIYEKVHTIGMDDAIWVPLYSKGLVMGFNKNFDCSKVFNPKGEIYFNEIR